MMYLSRLLLNPRSRQVRRDLTNPYDLHRTICKAFPGADFRENAPLGVLFRLETDPRTGIPTLLVQSRTQPVWDFLSTPGSDYLLPDSFLPLGIESNPAFKPFAPRLERGQKMFFRLRANPTVKKDREGKRQGRRVAITDPNEQRKWLERKLEEAGARLLSVELRPWQKVIAWKPAKPTDDPVRGAAPDIASPQGGARGNKLTLISVWFNGLLQVNDPELLLLALQKGIGSAKGLGFGLLSLARPRQ